MTFSRCVAKRLSQEPAAQNKLTDLLHPGLGERVRHMYVHSSDETEEMAELY